ncbi:hypothetical protein ElyMa_004918500 [Elysia marginata]|uniref:Uncharacterized protein n=1 Tax=Elysia marginata TaxID=1093978 RepID=A0AAV4IZ42_9GAST|nr:hypothetical protein ElyMa_004918500 [Elysia marginata]
MKGIRGQVCTPATSVPGRRNPAKIFKAAGPAAFITSTSHLSMPGGGGGREEDMPKDFRDATVVPLFNLEDSKVVCGSYHTVKCLEGFGLRYLQPFYH